MPSSLRVFVLVLLSAAMGRSLAQFGPGQALPDISSCMEVQAIDMDLDGTPDLVAALVNGTLHWARNSDGQGTFDDWQPILSTVGTIHLYTLTDLGLDGLPDLVVLDGDGQLMTLLNLGNGQFAPAEVVTTLPATVNAMACRDITGDGLPDVVVSLPTGNGSGFAWLANNGAGFEPLTMVPDLHPGPASNLLLIADLDEVGGNDVVLQDGWGNIHVHRNMDGNATAWTPDVMVAFPMHPYTAPQLMDMDADGDLDLVEARNGVVHWAENRLGEGGSWLPFTDHGLEAFGAGGLGVFGGTPCSTGATVVYRPDDDDLPMRWRTYLPVLQGLSYAGDLPDLPRGDLHLMADLNGDGRQDILMERPDGLSWHANLLGAPVTELVMPVFDTLCVFGPPVQLPSVEPAGGQWSGPWVIGDVLHRSNIGTTGSYPIAHTIYESAGCPVAGVSPFQLLSGPVVTPDLGGLVCTAGPIQLQAEPANVQWSGIGADGVLDPATYGGGSFACVFNDASGMQCATIIAPVNIGSVVPVAIAPAGPFCITDAIQGIGASIMPLQGGFWSGDIAGTVGNVALFDPSAGAGTYQVILHVEPGGPQQCSNSDTLLITVSDVVPEVSVTSFGPHCVQGSAIILTGAQPAGGTWSGNGIQAGVMEPSLLGPGVHPVTYTYVAPEGCSASITTPMELVEEVVLNWNADDLTLCPGDGPIEFGAWPEGGTWSEPVSASGILEPALLGMGPHPVIYTWTAPNCTLQNPPVEVVVLPLSEVIIDPVPVLCHNGTPHLVTANLSGTWSGAVSGTGNSIWFDPALLGEGTWTVQLYAEGPDACPALASVEVVVDLCSGIGDAGKPFTIEAAPNPFNDFIALNMPHGTIGSVEVYDGTGRHLLGHRLDGVNGVHRLDLGHVAPGTYVLQVNTIDGRRATVRLMKN